ncbi:MAG: hypothetical protein IJA35_00235 [Clostridia bacterium]|nr:hypothetical protein [Clostridia bacterium]
MKRIFTLLLAFIMLVSLSACGNIMIFLQNPEVSGSFETAPNESISETDNYSKETANGILNTPEASLPELQSPSLDPTDHIEDPQQTPTDEPDTLWDKLLGCWSSTDGERFVYFLYSGGEPAFLSGLWGNPIPYRRDAGTLSSPVDFGGGFYTISLTYPPVSEDAADAQELEPLLYTLAIDISEIENGKIRVEAPEDIWRDYTYAGADYDTAYENSVWVNYASFDEMRLLWY